MLLWICAAGFFAAFVDAIVGGGGLISIPALLAAGLPTHLALGTNKMASSFGAVSSVWNYYRGGAARLKVVLPLLPFSLVGSMIGVKVVLGINADFLQVMIIVLVAVIGLYTLLKKDMGMDDQFEGIDSRNLVAGIIMALGIGFYDGFFGPGTGSFLIFGFIHLFKFDFKHATANAKFLNLTSNLAALTLFIVNGQVMFTIGIPMAACMILGAKVGTYVAIKKGSGFIKPVFVIVSFALVTKMAIGLLMS